MRQSSPLPDLLARKLFEHHTRGVRNDVELWKQTAQPQLTHGAGYFGPYHDDQPLVLKASGDGFLSIGIDGTLLSLQARDEQRLPSVINELVERLDFQACSLAVMLGLAHYITYKRLPSAAAMGVVRGYGATVPGGWNTFDMSRIPTERAAQQEMRAWLKTWRQRPSRDWAEAPWLAAMLAIDYARYSWTRERLAPVGRGKGTVEGTESAQRLIRDDDEALPAFVAEMELPHLGFSICQGSHLIDLPWQWRLVARGPSPVPTRFKQLGAPPFAPSPALTDAGRRELLTITESCIAQADYPGPRYLGQEITVPMPRSLRRRLLRWGILAADITPQRDGIWCIPIRTDGPTPGFWWSTRAPYIHEDDGIDETLRLVLAAAMAALWFDLCAEVITIEREAPADGNTQRSEASTPRRGRAVVILPPVRYVGTWSNQAEQEAIEHTIALPGRYRVLPRGWAERANDPGFKARQQAAAERAAEEGFDRPLPGYTFVRKHDRRQRGRASDAPPQRTTVLSRGLMSISLGLSRVLEEATTP